MPEHKRHLEFALERLSRLLFDGAFQSTTGNIDGIGFYGVREKELGEAWKQIDWPRTLSHHYERKVFLRLREAERIANVALAIDCSFSTYLGSGGVLKHDVMLSLARALAEAAVAQGCHVRFFLFAEKVEYVTTNPITSRRQLEDILSVVARHTPRLHRSTGVKETLRYLSRTAERPSLIFFLSDFLVPRGWEMSLRALLKEHALIPLSIRDPHDRRGPAVPSYCEGVESRGVRFAHGVSDDLPEPSSRFFSQLAGEGALDWGTFSTQDDEEVWFATLVEICNRRMERLLYTREHYW